MVATKTFTNEITRSLDLLPNSIGKGDVVE